MTVENAPVTQPDAGDNSFRPSESRKLNFGISNQKDLAYLRDRNNPYDNFREAREIIRKRFLN